MKKIILFLITFLLIFNVYGDDKKNYLEQYNKAFVKLNESYDKFIGACNSAERLAIIKYAQGDLEKMSGGYGTVKELTTEDGVEINDYCANYAEDLYDAIKYGEDFAKDNKMISLKLENELEIKKNVFVTGNKIKDRKDLTVVDNCDLISKDFVKVMNEFLMYVQIGCVSLTIILCVIDLYKVVISKDLDQKKAFKNIKTRIIALVVVLLAPAIVNIVISLINRYVNVDALKCLES